MGRDHRTYEGDGTRLEPFVKAEQGDDEHQAYKPKNRQKPKGDAMESHSEQQIRGCDSDGSDMGYHEKPSNPHPSHKDGSDEISDAKGEGRHQSKKKTLQYHFSCSLETFHRDIFFDQHGGQPLPQRM